MTTVPTAQDIAKAFQTAPDYVKDYISSDELSQTFEEIRQSNKLHFDEADKLSRSLNAVFLKLNDSSEFPTLLKESLEQNSGAYDEVLKAVNQNIFNHFRTRLQNPEQVTQAAPSLKNAEQKLTSHVSEPNIFVEVDTLNDEKAVQEQDSVPEKTKPAYTGSADPYREPIE